MGEKNIDGLRPFLNSFNLDTVLKKSGIDFQRIELITQQFAHVETGVALAGPVGSDSRGAKDLALAVSLLNYATGRIGQTVDFSRTHALTGSGQYSGGSSANLGNGRQSRPWL
jgi:molybdopterin-containing oxidoreductase family iron-sulfur binding subunit